MNFVFEAALLKAAPCGIPAVQPFALRGRSVSKPVARNRFVGLGPKLGNQNRDFCHPRSRASEREESSWRLSGGLR